MPMTSAGRVSCREPLNWNELLKIKLLSMGGVRTSHIASDLSRDRSTVTRALRTDLIARADLLQEAPGQSRTAAAVRAAAAVRREEAENSALRPKYLTAREGTKAWYRQQNAAFCAAMAAAHPELVIRVHQSRISSIRCNGGQGMTQTEHKPDDAIDALIEPLTAHFVLRVPDPRRFIADLRGELLAARFDRQTLEAAARSLVRTRVSPVFPTVAVVLDACRRAANGGPEAAGVTVRCGEPAFERWVSYLAEKGDMRSAIGRQTGVLDVPTLWPPRREASVSRVERKTAAAGHVTA